MTSLAQLLSRIDVRLIDPELPEAAAQLLIELAEVLETQVPVVTDPPPIKLGKSLQRKFEVMTRRPSLRILDLSAGLNITEGNARQIVHHLKNLHLVRLEYEICEPRRRGLYALLHSVTHPQP